MCIARKIGVKQKRILKNLDNGNPYNQISAIGEKLDGLAKLFKLYPYNEHGQFYSKLKPISHKSIQAMHVLCPNAIICETVTCNP
jgi:hypothetical protein